MTFLSITLIMQHSNSTQAANALYYAVKYYCKQFKTIRKCEEDFMKWVSKLKCYHLKRVLSLSICNISIDTSLQQYLQIKNSRHVLQSHSNYLRGLVGNTGTATKRNVKEMLVRMNEYSFIRSMHPYSMTIAILNGKRIR